MLRSPILLKNRMKSQGRTIHLLQMKERRKRDTISRLRATAEVIPNINAHTILGDEKEWWIILCDMESYLWILIISRKDLVRISYLIIH